MPAKSSSADRKWAQSQVSQFKAKRPDYEDYARCLAEVLRQGVKPLAMNAIVQARAKTVASFAEKIQRKKAKYRDPVNQLTDLCGGRAIVQTREDVQAVCDYVRSHFIIDEDNSEDTSTRLNTREFGYRSWHFIVQFDPNVAYPIALPKPVYGLKAEIQVRTILEHAWADIYHDRAYKAQFKLPERWEREMSMHAALLEDMDEEFSRILHAFDRYQSSYQGFMSEEELDREIALNEIVLKADPRNDVVAHRIGQLAMRKGDWQKARSVMEPFKGKSTYVPLLRDLGYTLCQLAADHRSPDYQEGLDCLELATEQPGRKDVDSHTIYASRLRPVDPAKADEYCETAFRLDHTDPYALTCYLTNEILRCRDVTVARYMRPIIESAIERCRDQIEVKMNIPWAWYSMGTFLLLLGHTSKAVSAYARGARESAHDWMIESSRGSIRKLRAAPEVDIALPGLRLAEQTLGICLALRDKTGGSLRAIAKHKSQDFARIDGPVLIVCGATDDRLLPDRPLVSDLITRMFEYYCGTVICGGTQTGICQYVGNLYGIYRPDLHTIGYLPEAKAAMADPGYGHLRYTDGDDFSILEALTYWAEIIASGQDPAQVKVLGYSGGDITAAELRIALVLGAKVGVVAESGPAVDELLSDSLWNTMDNLLQLPQDHFTLNAFADSFCCTLSPHELDRLAQYIHDLHAQDKYEQLQRKDLSYAPWPKTSPTCKHSSCEYVRHIERKLRAIGRKLEHVGGSPHPINFSSDELEKLSEMEHARWNTERALEGWTYGPVKSEADKRSPYLVPWDELPSDARDYDRQMVAALPGILADVGYRIV